MNYEDHASARRALADLREARGPHTFRNVKKAYIQGLGGSEVRSLHEILGPNLAFVVSSTDDAAVKQQGMAVFQDGRRIKDISGLLERFVTEDMCLGTEKSFLRPTLYPMSMPYIPYTLPLYPLPYSLEL